MGKYCLQCGWPLDYSEAKLLDDRVEKVTSAHRTSDLISDEEKAILETYQWLLKTKLLQYS